MGRIAIPGSGAGKPIQTTISKKHDAMIAPLLHEGEVYTTSAGCVTTLDHRLASHPILKYLFKVCTKHHILFVTNFRFINMEWRYEGADPIIERVTTVPLRDVASICVTCEGLHCTMNVAAQGYRYHFRKLPVSQADGLWADFKRFKTDLLFAQLP